MGNVGVVWLNRFMKKNTTQYVIASFESRGL
jgi:hypothetical protein